MMKDKDKTKEQLTNELVELRQRIAELKVSEAERKQAEEALRESEERYRHILEQSPIGIGIASLDGKVVTANKAMQVITGYSLEELKKLSLADIYESIEDREALLEAVSRYGSVVDFPVRKKRQDGTPYDALLSISRINIGGNDFLHTICQDITERKQAEEEIRWLKEFNEGIVQGVAEALLIEDATGIITFVNPALELLLGYTADELVGRHWQTIVSKEEVEQVQQKASRRPSDVSEQYETHLLAVDGTKIPVIVNARPLFEGEIFTGVLSAFTDITERKRAEEELRSSHRKLQAVFDAIQESMSVIDFDFNIRDVNSVLIKTFGLPDKESILGRKCFEVLKGRKDICTYCPVAEAYQTKAPVYRTSSPEEEVLTGGKSFEVFTYPVMDEHGNPVGVVEFARDITERKRADEALQESEKQFRELIENANDIIYTHDLEGNFTSANPAVTRIYGYTTEEALQLNIAQIVDPEYLPLARQKIREKLEDAPRTGPYELLTYSKESEPIWVEVSTRLLEREGQPIGVLGIARDITERKRAEEALRESEERYRSVVENSHAGIFIVDDAYRFTYVNEELCQILGRSREEIIGQDFRKFLDDESRELVADRYVRRQRGEEVPPRYEFNVVRKDGEKRRAEISSAVIRDSAGKVKTVAQILDITERKRAEEELRQSYVKLRRTLEGTVHALVSAIEMRDPYTAGHQRRVTLLACAIAKEMGLAEEQIEGIRMAGLIHDLGKINVPAEILSKPAQLTELEYGLIKMHPQIGHDVLKTIDFPWPVAQIVLQHHERMDGSGYPQGLSREEIILEARILGVADVVEAMASHRPYRSARGIDEALQEISQNRGTLYDPEVVDACVKLFTEKGFKFE
jgi:PAS domain S-box-containing protein